MKRYWAERRKAQGEVGPALQSVVNDPVRPAFRLLRRLVFSTALVASFVATAGARQQSAEPSVTDDDGQAHAEHAVVESMSGHQMHMGGPHLRLTAAWPEQPGDRERAATIVKALRRSARTISGLSRCGA